MAIHTRELENVIGAAIALCDDPLICASDLVLRRPSGRAYFIRDAKARVVTEFERSYISKLLSSWNGDVSEAARADGKNRRAFWELIRGKKHHIDVQALRGCHGHGLAEKTLEK